MTSFKIVPNTTQSTEVKVISNTESHNVAVSGFGGPKGEQGIQGVQGIQGEQGLSGVISVESPITNTGTDTEAILGIDQTLLEIEESQVVNLVSDLASKETPSGAQSKADTAQANAKTYADATFEPKTSNRLVPAGGTTGQILSKNSNTDYDDIWIDNYTSDVRQWVKNDGTALTKGTPVYVSSSNGSNMIVSAASNTAELTSSKTLGLLAQDLAINGLGWVITEGLLGGLNTSTATAGDPVWLGTNGTLIYGLANKPVAPAHLVFIGIVTRVQSQNGEIFVKVQNGFEVEELHNLLATNKQNNDLLAYDSATSLWKNKSLSSLDLLTATTATSTYEPKITSGTTAQYWRGDKTWATLPTALSSFTNDSGYITSSALIPYLTSSNAASTYVSLTGSYSNPSWITGLSWSKISSIPTTLAGYGITDVLTSSAIASTYAPLSSPTFTGTINATDMNVSGTLTIGTYNILNTTNLSVTDSIIYLANNQFDTDALDIGFYGAYGDPNPGHVHTGLVRDHTDGIWKLFSNGNEPSGQTVDLTSVTYDTLKIGSLKINNGLSSQFLKADGSLDSTSYLSTSTASSTYAALTASQTFTGRQTFINPNTTTSTIFIDAIAGTSAAPQVTYVGGTLVQQITSGGSGLFVGSLTTGSATSGLGSQLSVISILSNRIGVIIRGATSQSANLTEWQDSTGGILTSIGSDGSLAFGTSGGMRIKLGTTSVIENVASTTGVRINAYASNYVGVIVKGAASQTTDLQQWQDSTGTVLAKIDATGVINTSSYFNLTSATNGIGVQGTYALRFNGTLANFGTGTVTGTKLAVTNDVSTNTVLRVQGAASQTANLQEWQDSSATIRARISAAGEFFTVNGFYAGPNPNSSTAQVYVTSTGAGVTTLGLKAAASQTANIQEWLNNSGTVLASVSPGGTITTSADIRVANGVISYGYQNTYSAIINAVGGTPTTEPVLITKLRGSQTGDIQQWQDSTGTVLASIDSTGNITVGANAAGVVKASYYRGLGDTTSAFSLPGSTNVQLFSGSASVGGGVKVLGIANATTAPTSNPVNGGIMYVNAGALSYMGTSGTAATIVNADGTRTLDGGSA